MAITRFILGLFLDYFENVSYFSEQYYSFPYFAYFYSFIELYSIEDDAEFNKGAMLGSWKLNI